ncbi:MAG: polymerase subunit alpha, polymerase subunit alpha protein [Candidatus Adlerbacteria bacterium]|nr:polymerase subunit alpha, polymerase subunit alpha protein [Candidatus Adlerbacteria bacterium]
MSAPFVPLRVHSHYSLLKALPKIPDLVKKAKAEGCTALALTDLGNLYGAIEFYKECQGAGIKPIIGLESVMEGGKHILLYAKNRAGYQNLLKLVTKSHLNSPGNPMLTSAMLEEHGEGLITIDPKETDMPMREVFYIEPDDRRAWETLRAIENRGPVETGDLDEDEDDFSFPTAAYMEERYGAPAMQKTTDLAAECELDLNLGKWFFPDIEIPEGTNYDEELRRLVEEGLKRRFIQETPEARTRIEYEYEIITKKGYSPYFLVVADLLAFARANKILTTIRGSVAGSLTTYVLGITNVNPLAYKLPFERFLNPERPSAPDIDMDYADNRRDEVIEYARRKYGEDKVAQIGTFGTMLARGVVRDVARALGYPYGLGDAIAKEIPMGSQGFAMTLERAMNENPELAKMYKKDAQVREIIDLGQKIEGCARHVGVHAAGVVISPTPLTDYTPLQLDPKGGKLISQYDMYSIDENNAGLLKFDFLGIRNLAILAHSVELVEKTRGITIDIENVPVDDTKTFEMLARGETEGLFQLNGSGMTRFLKELKPSTIHDINAMVALYRPGPMETIPQYIERKHNPAMVSYADPRMKDYLEFSHGVLVYQDDVLLTAITLGGYSWLEADKLRKAMGKKIPEVMAAEKEKLIKGFIEYGKLRPQLAEKLWKLIEPFAAYGFNKAHAASYGKVAYQTAYMKANFPVEYMSAVLTAEAGDIETVSTMVGECKRMGLPVLAPDVNESFGDFTVILADNAEEKDAIRFGLYSIKNFGSGVADSIIAERKTGGPFVTLSDFLTRVKDNGLNKKGLESLIKCGALDSLGERGQMFAHIEKLLQYHRDAAADHQHESLFAGVAEMSQLTLPKAEPARMDDKLIWEKELLGLYVSGHPLDKFKEKLDKRPMNLAQIKERSYPGTTTVIAGMVEDLRVLLTKNGDQMAFLKLADFSGSVEAVVFPKSFVEYKAILRPEACIAIKGRVSNRNGEFSIVTEALKAL